ncbi:hypothetical protein LR48_Vigan09g147800 [Vigna angularis]|uniref:Plastocyanin-like domain-containing protein n=1 Tax=Phaseolus angularis TaxID=3914 RepID=A0A0L9VDS4_PHAAN|nr:hypothetical protein LR48_Vigan09g147800 [Vigna angularis]
MASSLAVLFFIPSFVLSSLCHALPREAAFDAVDVLLDSSLHLLSVGARIPTTLPGQSLTVTTSPSNCATFINNIKLTSWSIYDDVEKLAIKTNDWVPVQSKVAAMEAGHWRR